MTSPPSVTASVASSASQAARQAQGRQEDDAPLRPRRHLAGSIHFRAQYSPLKVIKPVARIKNLVESVYHRYFMLFRYNLFDVLEIVRSIVLKGFAVSIDTKQHEFEDLDDFSKNLGLVEKDLKIKIKNNRGHHLIEFSISDKSTDLYAPSGLSDPLVDSTFRDLRRFCWRNFSYIRCIVWLSILGSYLFLLIREYLGGSSSGLSNLLYYLLWFPGIIMLGNFLNRTFFPTLTRRSKTGSKVGEVVIATVVSLVVGALFFILDRTLP